MTPGADASPRQALTLSTDCHTGGGLAVAWPGCEHRLPTLPIVSLKGNAMAEPLDPNDLVTIEAPAISTMWETSALVEVLERGRGCC